MQISPIDSSTSLVKTLRVGFCLYDVQSKNACGQRRSYGLFKISILVRELIVSWSSCKSTVHSLPEYADESAPDGG